MDEAQWRSVDPHATTRYWWGEAIEVVGATTVPLYLHVVTHRPHPEKLFIQVAARTPEKPYIRASLVDAEGHVYVSATSYVGIEEVPSTHDDTADLTADLAALIEAAEGPLEAAKTILEAGWLPTADYDDWSEEIDDRE